MADSTRVQERDISNISSIRRNPVLADIFGRPGYMERQGIGFKKITEAYYAAYNYRAELEPKFTLIQFRFKSRCTTLITDRQQLLGKVSRRLKVLKQVIAPKSRRSLI